jgi:hypothetical protein
MMDPPLPPMIPQGLPHSASYSAQSATRSRSPPGANTIDDVRRLRLLDERAKLVTATVGRILRDPESDDDAMSDARTLRDAVADYPPDYSQHPLGN